MKRLFTMVLAFIMLCGAWACEQDKQPVKTGLSYNQKQIRRVNKFQDLPTNYEFFDYKKIAFDFDKVAFDFASKECFDNPIAHKALCYPKEQSTWYPVGFFDDSLTILPPDNQTFAYKGMSFGLPTYVADRRTAYGAYEAICCLPSLLSASFLGIDKSNQTINGEPFNFIDMAKAFYDKQTNCVLNTVSSTEVGQSTWYALYPQITYTRLYDFYKNDNEMKDFVINGGRAWLKALPKMKDKNGKYNFEFMGFDIKAQMPVFGDWVDPPCGAMAFLFLSCYYITLEQDFLDACISIMDYMETYEKNPNYEAMTDYLPYVASRLNADFNTNYNVGKYIDYLFENDSSVRQNWGMLNGKFGDYCVDGLVGDINYAFAMNSFNLASTLAPLLKYDTRFSDAVGKYLLNLVNNAKCFFPHEMPLSHQTMDNHLNFDPSGAICYEGFKKELNGKIGVACGDATSMFNQPCDLSLYSASHIGYLGALVDKTDVNGILQIDLNVADSFGFNDYPTYLYYNPYDEDKTITINVEKNSDLFNSINHELIAVDVQGKIKINIPHKSSVIIVQIPSNSYIYQDDKGVYVDNHMIGQKKVSINIVSPDKSRYNMKNGDVFRFNYSGINGDEPNRLVLKCNDITLYDGKPIKEFAYSKEKLPDTDYLFTAKIFTQNYSDIASTRIVAL